ncbi:Golgi transport complex subunit 1 [Geranomyces michiganensis]|nr:Golgi transport complex subunit 1 [Geranomyces michiganensis]
MPRRDSTLQSRRESAAPFPVRRESNMSSPNSRKNSTFPPPPTQSQSRIFDSFITKRAVLTDTAVLVNEDPDAVFEKYPVVEVRALLARTTVDIERKKQDLRVMVGERYRDLIDAADAIKTMSVAASEVDATFEAMRGGCDAQAIRRKAAEGKAKEAGGGISGDRRKTGVYAVAAQIKVLVDTPEQIWHAMEDDAYLKACRLYLVARQVYENLSTAEDTASLRPLHSFPVVKRQWNAVSHFRAQIADRSTSHLANIGQTPQVRVLMH